MAHTKEEYIDPLANMIAVDKVYSDPIVIKYDYIVEETVTCYFVFIVGRIIGLNKCSVEHNEKEKTMTILKEAY